ncbi:MAG: glycosyltransferase family 39 protein [Roseiflexaceae bacterium]
MLISNDKSTTPPIVASEALMRWWMRALIVVAIAFGLVNLTGAPHTWFDEGSHMMVPKTIVQDGVYADKSADGYRYHGPTIGVGPTVMLPIALSYQLFGIGLLQARMVIVLYLFTALALFFLLARRLHTPLIALVSVTILLASGTMSYEGMPEYGRQVLGEVPGLAFLFLGIWAWVAALQNPKQQLRWSLLAGLGFGLAVITKNQFTLIVMPTLTLITLLDIFYYRAGSWALRILPALIATICFGTWTVVQFAFLGPGTFMENMQQTRQAAGGAIFVFYMRSTLRAGYYLLRPDLYGGLLIPALIYGLWRARERSVRGLMEALPTLLVAIWLTWFVFVSLGWPRYAFPAVAIGAMLIGRAVVDFLAWLIQQKRPGAAIAAAGYVTLAVALSLGLTVDRLSKVDHSAEQMIAFMRQHVPEDTLVATWEPEMGALGNHRWDYPPQRLLDGVVRAQWLGGTMPTYDGLANQPPYVVVGNFGNLTKIYDKQKLGQEYVLIYESGPYTLFKRSP